MSDPDLDRMKEVAKACDPNDYETIWLQAEADGDASGEGRLWCHDKVWPACDDDSEPTAYVRADIAAALLERLEKAEAPVMLCRACGAVSSDDECDCTRAGLECRDAVLRHEAHREMLIEAEAENTTLRADLAEAVEALEPFERIADEYSDAEDDDFQVWKDFDVLGATLPLRIFRKARAARIVAKHKR